MTIKNLIVLMLASVLVTGCMATAKKPAMTPLQIQSLQSREYESKKDIVFPSIISVFQDIGYTITNADIQTGLISAESSSQSDFMSKFWLGMTKVSQTKATAFVEQIGDKTRARLNFVEIKKSSSGWGQSDREDTPLLDSKLYENAFNKIENAIFMRSQK
ncbi:hypothetical protein OAM56_00850 [Alphaproteobacteria bacterium]|jgi:hypothetical protein|nr:hypothetical protein [Alphaproteobacteria bacterium]